MMYCINIDVSEKDYGLLIDFQCDADNVADIVDIELLALTSKSKDITLPPVKITLTSDRRITQDTLQHISIDKRQLTLTGKQHVIERDCSEVADDAWQSCLEALRDMCIQRPLNVLCNGQDVATHLAAIEAAQAERKARWQTLTQTCSEAVKQVILCDDVPEFRKPWPDYLSFGLTREDVPALIEILERRTPDDDSISDDECFASIHALRALALLQAPSSLPTIMALCSIADDVDWIFSELPSALECFGEAAIPAMERAVLDKSLGAFVRSSLAGVLTEFALDDDRKRATTVACIVEALKDFHDNAPEFNGLLISELIQLRALEHTDLLAAIFAGNKADWSVCGDWEEVQVSLGLLEQRATPKPNFAHWGKTPEQIAMLETLTRREEEIAGIRKSLSAKDKERRQKRKQKIKQKKKARKKQR